MKKIKMHTDIINSAEISRIEELHDIKLPDDYRAHMLKYNGGTSTVELYFKPHTWDEQIKFSYLLPIKHGDYIFEEANLKGELLDFPEGQLIIGHTLTGTLSISLSEIAFGYIYVSYSDGEIHELAKSFTEFLEGLEEI